LTDKEDYFSQFIIARSVFQILSALGFIESLPYPPKGDESHASRITPPV
jgi:hypothetical protein